MKSQFVDDHFYHVYNRGVRKSLIFYSDANYRHCLFLLKKYCKKYGVEIISYCLMPNHYHLLLRQKAGGSIARFLQTTFNAYAQALNKQERFHGTLFESRAQSLCVDSEAYLLRLACYIHCNPVVAGLVLSPEEWKYSDYSKWVEVKETGDEYANIVKIYLEEIREMNLEKYLFKE